jgi:hypothetical protein
LAGRSQLGDHQLRQADVQGSQAAGQFRLKLCSTETWDRK